MTDQAAKARLRLVSAHPAITPTNIPAAQFAARELSIEIYPRGYDWWCGTSAQLIAEGVIPQDFEWPQGQTSKSWTAGSFEFWLFRTRPEGHKGPKPTWAEADNWACRRVLATQAKDGFATARVYEARMALAQELWKKTPAFGQQFKRYWTAQNDKAFQAFKAMVIPPPKKRGRTSKANATPQGAQAS